VRWGLIGASTIASEWMINAIRAQEGHAVASVLSSDASRAKDYAGRHGIPEGTSDMDALLAASDAVYISTTNEKHHAQALAAIGAGKHVICEKPLAMTLAEATEMVTAAREAGVVFATNHHLRCAGSHRAVRGLIEAGRLGEILSVRVFHAVRLPDHLRGWRIDNPAAGGGVIVDITVHDADTVRFYLDEDPAEVVAQSGSHGLGRGVEDSAMSVWRMPSGVMVQSHESFTHPFAGNGVEVHGTEGSVFARNVMTQKPQGEITLVDGGGSQPVAFPDHDLYAQGVAEFAAAIRGAGRPAADGVDGVKSLAVALAVREAADTGRRVAIDYGGVA
jgi:1,5-anhydro-D-fructose reductase (1,5-anhydro-D-mannitol-forming)